MPSASTAAKTSATNAATRAFARTRTARRTRAVSALSAIERQIAKLILRGGNPCFHYLVDWIGHSYRPKAQGCSTSRLRRSRRGRVTRYFAGLPLLAAFQRKGLVPS